MPAYCGAWSLVSEDADGVKHAIPMRCRSWGCSICGQRNRRRLLARLKGVTVRSLMTLTCSPTRYASRTDAFEHMSVAVNTLLKRLRRASPGNSIEYFLVWELTAQGWPHAHLLLQAPFIPQRRISAAWAELTGAPVVDIRKAHGPAETVAYIAKYLSKDPAAPPGCKRYRFSRHFMLAGHYLRPDPHGGPRYWRIEHTTPAQMAMAWSSEGLTCELHSDGSSSAYPRGHPSSPLFPSAPLMDHGAIQPSLPRSRHLLPDSVPYTGSSPWRYSSRPHSSAQLLPSSQVAAPDGHGSP